jgi:hypothetical protein
MERPGRFTFSVEGSLAAAAKGEIEEWVLSFLDQDPYQRSLAPAYRAQKNYWVGPVKYSLNGLKRIAGVGQDLLFPTTPEKFEARVNKIIEGMENGWEPAPLIISDYWGDIHISDGNHRHEALLRKGITDYWVIFQSQSESGRKKFMKIISGNK